MQRSEQKANIKGGARVEGELKPQAALLCLRDVLPVS